MSITIKHLEGPLKDKLGQQSFDDAKRTILVGRSGTADIAYPEECIAVDQEHFTLNRDDGGEYRIGLPGSCDVEIDGRPAEDGEPVTSGSVITVGTGGPSFEVLLPGVTIKHLEGPLAGKRHYFPFGTEKITFGRLPRQNDVGYPEDCTIVGRNHFSLKGDENGNYCVELTPNHYVQIGKSAANNGDTVQPSSTFRLGNKTGPSFSVAVEKPQGAGKVTEDNIQVAPVHEKIDETGTKIEHTRKYGTYAIAGLATLLVALGIWSDVRDRQYQQYLNQVRQQLATGLAATEDKLSKLAEKDIPLEAQTKLLQAVYLVAKHEKNQTKGQATAWAFAPDKLATNAHVAKEIAGNEKSFLLIAPDGTKIELANARVEVHPAYFPFIDYKRTLGQLSGDKFKALDIIKEYDVAIIHLAEPLPGNPVVLELADSDHLKKLKPGAPVASVGFPMEGMTGTMVVTKAPASLRFGNIGALTDVFMSRADADKLFLIQHSVPVAGGVSGSPLIDASGMVIGIVSGGTTTKALKEVSVELKQDTPDDENPKDDKKSDKSEGQKATETFRIPSAAMINFAHRSDLLEDMISGEAKDKVAGEEAYWDSAAKSFDRYFDGAVKRLLAFAAKPDSYGVSGDTKSEIGAGTLQPAKDGSWSLAVDTHKYELEPDHVYAFIADAKSGVPLALNVKKKSGEVLRDAKDPQKSSIPQLAPVVWVTVEEKTPVEIEVFSLTDRSANYALYVYDWKLDEKTPAAADASSVEE